MNKVMSSRQQYWHEHLQRADEMGLSLAAYARDAGLNLKQLYAAKAWLVKLGYWPRSERATRAASIASSRTAMNEFVAVHVSSTPVTALRLRHSSGWALECDDVSVAWLAPLLSALSVAHASA